MWCLSAVLFLLVLSSVFRLVSDFRLTQGIKLTVVSEYQFFLGVWAILSRCFFKSSSLLLLNTLFLHCYIEVSPSLRTKTSKNCSCWLDSISIVNLKKRLRLLRECRKLSSSSVLYSQITKMISTYLNHNLGFASNLYTYYFLLKPSMILLTIGKSTELIVISKSFLLNLLSNWKYGVLIHIVTSSIILLTL